MSPRMGTLTISLTLRTFPEEVEEARWREGIRFLFGSDAELVIARADELSLTTTMDRAVAREQAEAERTAVYAQRIRDLARE